MHEEEKNVNPFSRDGETEVQEGVCEVTQTALS